MNDKQIKYLASIQNKRESGKLPQKTQMEIAWLFSYSPVKSAWRWSKLGKSLLDMPAIPGSVTDEKIIKKIASLLEERTLKSIIDPKAPQSGESRKKKDISKYKNPKLIKIGEKTLLSKAGIDWFNNQINNAIAWREALRAKKIPEDLRRNVPRDQSGKIRFSNTQQIIDFVRKKHLSPETHTSSKIVEYKHITCHLLKEMMVQENYDQFKKDIDRATEIFENYALEEFIYFFTFANPSQKPPETIEELQWIQLKITKDEMKAEWIKYNKDIEFWLITRSKTADSIKKKTRGNLDQSSADQLMDIWWFRQIGIKTDPEGIKQSHIIQYYLQKKMNRQSYLNDKYITSKIPYTLEEIQKLWYSLTEEEVDLVVSRIDSIIKSKGILYSTFLNAHQSNKPDIHALDYSILQELWLTDPIVIRQMELEIERTNKSREEIFYKKQSDKVENKRSLFLEMDPKKYLWITEKSKEIMDIVFWYISNHNKIWQRQTKHPRIDWTKDMIVHLEEWQIKCNYKNKKGIEEEIILDRNKVNEFTKMWLEKWKEKEANNKGKLPTAWTRTKNGQISDLKSAKTVYTKDGNYFKWEFQTYMDQINGEPDPYSDDLIYQIMKDVSPHAERDVFITRNDIENYIQKKIINELRKSVKWQNLLEKISEDSNNKYVTNHKASVEEKFYEYIVNKFWLRYNEKYDIYQGREQKMRVEKWAKKD